MAKLFFSTLLVFLLFTGCDGNDVSSSNNGNDGNDGNDGVNPPPPLGPSIELNKLSEHQMMNQDIELTAELVNVNENPKMVDFYANQNLISSVNAPPYRATWSTGTTATDYTIQAKATLTDGQVITTTPQNVSVIRMYHYNGVYYDLNNDLSALINMKRTESGSEYNQLIFYNTKEDGFWNFPYNGHIDNMASSFVTTTNIYTFKDPDTGSVTINEPAPFTWIFSDNELTVSKKNDAPFVFTKQPFSSLSLSELVSMSPFENKEEGTSMRINADGSFEFQAPHCATFTGKYTKDLFSYKASEVEVNCAINESFNGTYTGTMYTYLDENEQQIYMLNIFNGGNAKSYLWMFTQAPVLQQ